MNPLGLILLDDRISIRIKRMLGVIVLSIRTYLLAEVDGPIGVPLEVLVIPIHGIDLKGDTTPKETMTSSSSMFVQYFSPRTMEH